MIKNLFIIYTFVFPLLLLIGCQGQGLGKKQEQEQEQNQSKKTLLSQCKTLGDEAILYARANYVKLFYEINPEKFADAYNKVKDFNNVTHRNIIDTYNIAVQKLEAKDPVSKSFLESCKALSEFSQKLVDQDYPQAISFKNNSKLNPLTDDFFLEINKIIKFDHNIGEYKNTFIDFKVYVKNYKTALKQFIEKYKNELIEQK